MTTTSVPARVGAPYEIGRTSTGLIILSREINGRFCHLVFGDSEALAIADALVDTVERSIQ